MKEKNINLYLWKCNSMGITKILIIDCVKHNDENKINNIIKVIYNIL